MAAPDPVDFRLLSLIAEMGRAAVHDVAARLGIDPREAAARLVALSATGMPLVVGVECDPNGIRAALAAARAWSGQQQAQPQYGQPQYPQQQPQYAPPPQQQHGPPQYMQPPQYAQPQAPVSVPFPAQQPPPAPQEPANTWGPPGSAAWARGDQPPAPVNQAPRTYSVGSSQLAEGLEGEQLSIQLVEVVDPADFLFTAAGYRLQDGERAVVVHTELTNRGSVAFSSLPDLYLVLVAADGQAVTKAPVSLSSRPPHRIGVQPGETAGGHTVYVLPESTPITSVRWSPRPDDPTHSLTWLVEN